MQTSLLRNAHAPTRLARSLCLRANHGCAMGLLQAANTWPGRA